MHEETPEPWKAPLPAPPGQQCPGGALPPESGNAPLWAPVLQLDLPPLHLWEQPRRKMVWAQGRPGLTSSLMGSNKGAQPRGHDHGHALSLWNFVPGGCREGTAEPLKPHTIIFYLQEFGSQASRLSPGSPERTCLPSSAPSLPCKAKNRIWLYQGNSGLLLS